MQLLVKSAGRLRLIFLILPIFYFLVYGLIGFTDTDQGFIQALSWRVVNGQIPYQDFIYVRPPFSIYFHTIPFLIFPDQWVFIIERFLFYAFMAMAVYWTTRSLEFHFDFKKIGLSPELFAVLAFIFSVHNFAPMPWHTVDGLLFAALGINQITLGKSMLGHSFGIFCLFLAAMTKQAFYPLIVVGPVLLGLLHGRKALIRGIIGGFSPIILLIFYLLIVHSEWLFLMIEQTTAISKLDDLIETGIIKYIKPFFIISLPLIFAWRAQVVYDWKYLPVSIFGAFFLGLLGLHVFKALQTGTTVGPSYGFTQGFFLLAVGIALKDFWLNNKASALLLALLAVSWCAGISWGYANNMLFFTPILFGFIYILYQELGFTVPRYFFGGICILLLWVFGTLYQYPYRDAPRSEIEDSPAEYFPQFNYIFTGDTMIQKIEEFYLLTNNNEGTFTVLPAFPLAHYLTETQNPLSVDWAHNVEAIYSQNQQRLEKELDEKTDYVLIQKDRLKEAEEEAPYGSLITAYVIDNEEWVEDKSQEKVYFKVFKKNKP